MFFCNFLSGQFDTLVSIPDVMFYDSQARIRELKLKNKRLLGDVATLKNL